VSAPVLELRADCLQNPGRLDVAVVESWMIWPDDEGARDRWVNAALLAEGIDKIDHLPVEIARDYAKLAISAPRLSDLQNKHAEHRFTHGLIAGSILFRAVAPNPEPTTKIVKDLCEKFRGTIQITPPTIHNAVLPRFRAVMHLFAAHIHATPPTRTICRPNDLGRFLATAEAYRELAENTRAPRATRPLLMPGEALRLPAHITPTRVSITF
jgi:hypothetical protein